MYACSYDILISTWCIQSVSMSLFVTLHHEMSRNVPMAIFMFLYFLKVNSMLFTMVKPIFKSEN